MDNTRPEQEVQQNEFYHHAPKIKMCKIGTVYKKEAQQKNVEELRKYQGVLTNKEFEFVVSLLV